MKERKKEVVIRITRVMIVLIGCLLVGGLMYAEHKEKNIPLKGIWVKGHRSISTPTVPVSANINQDILFIQCLTFDSDLIVSIVKEGTIVREQIVSNAEVTHVVIPVQDLEVGTYTLELRNKWGGYLYGEFYKQ